MNHTLLHRVEDLRLVSNDRYHPLEIDTKISTHRGGFTHLLEALVNTCGRYAKSTCNPLAGVPHWSNAYRDRSSEQAFKCRWTRTRFLCYSNSLPPTSKQIPPFALPQEKVLMLHLHDFIECCLPSNAAQALEYIA